ncbi:hypothetical protein [Methanosarcina sp. 2.H.A.1B.4]|uniref:hypothetical protein n=1 Tax=Methanosarcina sp. 2.H.A.1B.4 TaxID=1483600 RepID=UPI0012E0BE8A|nr:hypothetical protein [Methanosarcina sp. 2.H.A.1B.4]
MSDPPYVDCFNPRRFEAMLEAKPPFLRMTYTVMKRNLTDMSFEKAFCLNVWGLRFTFLIFVLVSYEYD